MNRIIEIKEIERAREELCRIGVSTQGIEIMARKALNMVVKITGVRLGAANIIKQEMLSIGGDAAVARGVVNGKSDISDVILLANLDKIGKLIRKLKKQSIFGLPEICSDLEKFYRIKNNLSAKELNCRGKKITLDQVRIQGILNITPDSFSDGKHYLKRDEAIKRALEMVEQGADIIDIGGESTRPGSEKVDLDKELDRVIPIIKDIRDVCDIPISVDTYKSDVAWEALKAGADIINDISALRFDEKMFEVLNAYPDVPVIIMHMQGEPGNMQLSPFYEDVVDEILTFLQERIDLCVESGIDKERIIVDPGIGFGKRHQDNLTILRDLDQFKSLDVALLLGASRKSFINRIYKSVPLDRLEGSLATTALAWDKAVDIIRVHDVKEHHRFLKVLNATREIT